MIEFIDPNMRDASYVVAVISAIALLAAFAAWWNVLRQPARVPIAGLPGQDNRRESSAAIATLAAFGLSLMAAILAILGSLS